MSISASQAEPLLTMHGVTKEITLPVQFLGFGKDPWGNERAGFEIDVIVQKGFPAYFLITADLMAHPRSVGIRVGPGRGSAEELADQRGRHG